MYPVDPFNPRDDAQRLRDALSGFSTDESAIINVLCRRPADQREVITQTYNDVFNRVNMPNHKWVFRIQYSGN